MDLSELERLEAQTQVLKLSEAIRIGAKMRPQCQRAYFSEGMSCAFGAAWEALGREERPTADRIIAAFNIPRIIGNEVVFMNDHGKSREQIADWLESQGY